MITEILGEVCLRKDCKERFPLPCSKEKSIKLQLAIKALILMFAGMLIGSALAIRLRGQAYHPNIGKLDPETIILTTKVSMMETTLTTLVNKVDKIQSQADTTEAIGTGIGVSITFLQLLGFLVSRKEKV